MSEFILHNRYITAPSKRRLSQACQVRRLEFQFIRLQALKFTVLGSRSCFVSASSLELARLAGRREAPSKRDERGTQDGAGGGGPPAWSAGEVPQLSPAGQEMLCMVPPWPGQAGRRSTRLEGECCAFGMCVVACAWECAFTNQ